MVKKISSKAKLMKYGQRTTWWEHGSVMTDNKVVKFMLDVSGYSAENDLSKITILEPWTWYGAFMLEIIERLFLSSEKYNFSFEKSLQKNVLWVEIDIDKVIFLRKKIEDFLNQKNINNTREIAERIIKNQNYLTSSVWYFKIVIGNPPLCSTWADTRRRKKRI